MLREASFGGTVNTIVLQPKRKPRNVNANQRPTTQIALTVNVDLPLYSSTIISDFQRQKKCPSAYSHRRLACMSGCSLITGWLAIASCSASFAAASASRAARSRIFFSSASRRFSFAVSRFSCALMAASSDAYCCRTSSCGTGYEMVKEGLYGRVYQRRLEFGRCEQLQDSLCN